MLLLLCLGATTLWLLYQLWTAKYNYWKDRGIPYLNPTFPFGNVREVIMFTRFGGEAIANLYTALQGHRYGGIISLRTPQLMVRDPEIIKLVMTKDFTYFVNRFEIVDKDWDPVNYHLFNMVGSDWKNMRMKLSPTFTSGKIKGMFPLMKGCAEELRLYFEEIDCITEVEIKGVMSRFTTDIIGTCAFGLDLKTITQEDSQFQKIGKQFFTISFSDILLRLTRSITPGLAKVLKLRTLSRKVSGFFLTLVKDTVEYREKNEVTRKDFLDLLIQLKNKGQVEMDEAGDVEKRKGHNNKESKVNMGTTDVEMTLEVMTAQSFVFFIAGFETSSTVLSFCLYELALAPLIQEEVRSEIDVALEKNGGITYEALQECVYLDKVIAESLRKYPPVPNLARSCTKTYQIPGTDHIIERGIRVNIPIWALHHDPHYFPDPEKFDPERFTSENKETRHPYTYLPFGEGPRNCIGMRFGLLQTKLGLATLLANYQFSPSLKSKLPIKFDPKSFVPHSISGIHLRIAKRNGL